MSDFFNRIGNFGQRLGQLSRNLGDVADRGYIDVVKYENPEMALQLQQAYESRIKGQREAEQAAAMQQAFSNPQVLGRLSQATGLPIETLQVASRSPEALKMLGSLTGANSGGTAQDRAVTALMSENPGMTYQQALYLYQAGLRRGQNVNTQTGAVAPIPGTLESAGALKQAEEAAKLQAKLQIDPQITAANIEAEGAAKKELVRPEQFETAARTYVSSIDRAKRFAEVADRAAKFIAESPATEGIASQMTAEVAGSPEFNLQQELKPLISQQAFDFIGELKSQSATGATGLGQVAIKEFEAIQSLAGQLVPGMKDARRIEILNEIKERSLRLNGMIKEMHVQKYGSEFLDRAQQYMTAGQEAVDTGGASLSPDAPVTGVALTTERKYRVRDPNDGKIYTIPESQIDAAVADGVEVLD